MVLRCLFSLLGIVFTFSACREARQKETTVMMVKADTVRRHQHDLVITYPGRIKAAAEVDLAFRVAGPIISLPVEVGSFVHRGEIVAEIDPRDYELQYKATEAEYKQIKAEAERVMELYHRKSVPINDYDKAAYGLQQITSKYYAHRNALNDTKLRAPFDGYIQKKYFDTHETVSAGIPVVSMINTHYYDIEIDIPSSDYIRQSQFRSFSCTPDVYPDHEIPLEFIDITKKANLNQLYRMRLRMKPEKDLQLAAGMSVNVQISYIPEDSTLVVVPLTSVFEKNGKSQVWIYDPIEHRISSREVSIRQIIKNGLLVLSGGVQCGEMVITAGVHKLKEGMQVEVLRPTADTNIGGLL